MKPSERILELYEDEKRAQAENPFGWKTKSPVQTRLGRALLRFLDEEDATRVARLKRLLNPLTIVPDDGENDV